MKIEDMITKKPSEMTVEELLEQLQTIKSTRVKKGKLVPVQTKKVKKRKMSKQLLRELGIDADDSKMDDIIAQIEAIGQREHGGEDEEE